MYYLLLILLWLHIFSCAPDLDNPAHNQGDQQRDHLPQEDREFIERFNTIARDIRDLSKPYKDLDKLLAKHFYIWKNVSRVEDAQVIFFGETHTHSASQMVTAGAINRLIKPSDIVLLEGYQAKTEVKDLSLYLTANIFTAREFEKYKDTAGIEYKATSRDAILQKHLQKIKNNLPYLSLNIFNFTKAKAYFWDLLNGGSDYDSMNKRNQSMVDTIKDMKDNNKHVMVIAGALHLPHYEYTKALYYNSYRSSYLASGGKLKELNDDFYRYFLSIDKDFTTTKVIYDYLKTVNFAVLIPKSLINKTHCDQYCPDNAI